MDYQEMKADLLERIYTFSAWIMEKPSSFDKEHFELLPVLLKMFFEHGDDTDCRYSPRTQKASPEITA